MVRKRSQSKRSSRKKRVSRKKKRVSRRRSSRKKRVSRRRSSRKKRVSRRKQRGGDFLSKLMRLGQKQSVGTSVKNDDKFVSDPNPMVVEAKKISREQNESERKKRSLF